MVLSWIGLGWVGLMTSAPHHDTLLRSDGSIEVIYRFYNIY
jgi:hypothetical protein